VPLVSGTHEFAASRDVSRDPPCDPQTMTLRCLIIDDSQCFLDAARSLLERQGMMMVGVASSTAEALQDVEELRPDVILLDIDLGGESGLELAKRLSCEPGQARPAVILISTYGEQDYAELIAASPAIGFLPKAALSAAAIEQLLARCGGHNQAD
jgi:DNA-binding NarL/FixJ family response regulator